MLQDPIYLILIGQMIETFGLEIGMLRHKVLAQRFKQFGQTQKYNVYVKRNSNVF